MHIRVRINYCVIITYKSVRLEYAEFNILSNVLTQSYLSLCNEAKVGKQLPVEEKCGSHSRVEVGYGVTSSPSTVRNQLPLRHR